MQTIAALIATNININTIINATATRPPGKNPAIEITLYIEPTGENPKPATGPKQKYIDIATITAIKKAGLEQKPINTGTAITD